jgi:aryl-alcohol dehydrogenase-like predicted oxidoreductase
MIQQRNIGKSGLRVSATGLGCNNSGRSLDLAASLPFIHDALDLGITFFDCADVYGRRGGAETILAQMLRPRRKDIILTTKEDSRSAVRRAGLTISGHEAKCCRVGKGA